MSKQELILRGAKYCVIQQMAPGGRGYFAHDLEDGTTLMISLADICNYLNSLIGKIDEGNDKDE